MFEADITIVGAGVIGLAIAREVADRSEHVLVLERHPSFGQETSSRNSEVIHAGIYYPEGSAKAKTCVEGNRLLYQVCEENGVPCKRLEKLIVATGEGEIPRLEELLELGRSNGVSGLKLVDKKELSKMEPAVTGLAALFSPSTGIVDSHELMKYFLYEAESHGAMVAYNCDVIGIDRKTPGYEVAAEDADGEVSRFRTRILIDCAGLESDRIAEMAGIDVGKSGYKLNFCKGEYFRLGGNSRGLVGRLVYPVTGADESGLGIHVTLDLAGGIRLGPDDEYLQVREQDYSVNESKRRVFCEEVRKFLPSVEEEDLSPDMAGIRPKLQGPGEGFRDFVIKEESGKGLEGFISLIGIESPGLTSSVAIARCVKEIVREISR